MIAFCGFLSTNALAVPAPPHPFKDYLPDGTTITIKMTGDEFFMYTTTIDGYNILKAEDGFYYYAEAADGKLTSTGVRASDPGRRSVEEKAVLSRVLVGQPSWAEEASKNSPLRRDRSGENVLAGDIQPTATNWTGNYKSVVILVNFQDIQFSTPEPKQAFSNMLNQKDYSRNGATGSVNQYYFENSNGKFNPTFDVVGPYTVSGPRSKYSWQSGNPGLMVQEAIDLANVDVDFSTYVKDGSVPSVFVYYAGEANQTTAIWPHMNWIYYRVDNVSIDKYGCSSELETNNSREMTNIGTFCHEFGHVTDWPDFYDTDYGGNGQSIALEYYSVMDMGSYNNNSRTPPTFTAQERIMKGWMTPDEFMGSQAYTISPVSENKAYIIPTDNEGEYFLVEVRSSEDSNGPNIWEEKLSRQLGILDGMPIMMVYHVDRSGNIVGGRPARDHWWPANSVNVYSNHECFKVVRAHKGNQGGWGYPGPMNVESLKSASNDEFKMWNNKPLIEEFTSIEQDGNNIKVNYYDGTDPTQYINLTEIGDNYVEAEWSTFEHDGTFTVQVYDADDRELQEFETTDKMTVVTMLAAGTTYTLKVTAKGENKSDSKTFKTIASSSSIPYLPLEGTYAAGETIPLRLSGVTESIVSSEWTLDGTAVDSYIITPPAGKHTISVKVVLEDGNEEIFIKTITVQ